MIADLAGLIAPLSVEEFRAHLARRVPIRLRSGGDVATLLDWDGFIDAALADDFPTRNLQVTKARRPLPPIFYRKADGVKRDAIAKVLEGGGSVVAKDMQRSVPALVRLCDSAAAETGEHIQCAAVGSTGEHGALPTHYDTADVLIVQIEGQKHWVVHADPMVNPVMGMRQIPAETAPVALLDIVLAPGDMLLLPGGYRHYCTTASGRSLHLGLLFHPLTAPRAVDLMMRELSESPVARQPIRGDADDDEAQEAALKQMLLEQVERLSLARLRAAHRTTGLPKPVE